MYIMYSRVFVYLYKVEEQAKLHSLRNSSQEVSFPALLFIVYLLPYRVHCRHMISDECV